MSSWIQPLADEASRVTIPHTGEPVHSWAVEADYTFFEGRTFPVGARGEHVTSEWAIDTTWPTRTEAEAFLDLLRGLALAVDARVEVHIGAMEGGEPVEFVGEIHEIPQSLAPAKTTVSLTIRQVDDA